MWTSLSKCSKSQSFGVESKLYDATEKSHELMGTRPSVYPMPLGPQYRSRTRCCAALGSRANCCAAASVNAPPKPNSVCFRALRSIVTVLEAARLLGLEACNTGLLLVVAPSGEHCMETSLLLARSSKSDDTPSLVVVYAFKAPHLGFGVSHRSEERRVGKEC